MGYGHQRAAYPLRYIAETGEFINANDYQGIPDRDKKIWEESRTFYEFISRFKKVPVFGKLAFDFYDRLQEIPKFYPNKDWSKPTLQLRYFYWLIRKFDWGGHLIRKLAEKPLPLVTTFFVTAFMAEEHEYPNDIYCLCTDTDVSRSWVPQFPAQSRIKYLAPTLRVQQRLKQYGVKSENIFLTGFPLPKRNIGGEELPILRKDLAERLCNLDPKRKYISKYADTISRNLGGATCPMEIERPFTIMFAVGGAGAQRHLGIQIVESLSKELILGKANIVLVAGIHNDVARYFKTEIKKLRLDHLLKKQIRIVHADDKNQYFKDFEDALREVDVIWTKPSELSFYTALGYPIIMAPPIGSQEKFNRKWLITIGSGVDQEDPQYTDEWLFDLLNSGWLAEAAMQGFMEAPRQGAYNIAKVIAHKEEQVERIKTILQY